MFGCFLRKFKHWFSVCFLRKKTHIQSKSSSSLIGKSNHVSGCIPIFLVKTRTSSVIPMPPKSRSSKSNSNSIYDLNESAFIFVEIMGGSLPLFDVLDLKKREKSERFGFSVMEESMGGASLPSGPNKKKRCVNYFYKPSIGDYYYGQGHPLKPHRIRMAHNLFGFCQSSASGSIGAAVKLNRGDADIPFNWVGGLHHAKKLEASGFCYIMLGILDQTE